MAAKKTKAQLEWEVLELKGQLANQYAYSYKELQKCGDTLHGSGVLLRLNGLGGRQLITPIVIRDGLSEETILAISRDLKRSQNLAIEMTINLKE